MELEHMQQTELLRRRQVVSQMPAQIFQPLYKRQEVREDWQRDMEFAFEDMYTGERRTFGTRLPSSLFVFPNNRTLCFVIL